MADDKTMYDNPRVPDYNTLPDRKYQEGLARQLASKRLIEGEFPETTPMAAVAVSVIPDTTPNGPEGVEYWGIEEDFTVS